MAPSSPLSLSESSDDSGPTDSSSLFLSLNAKSPEEHDDSSEDEQVTKNEQVNNSPTTSPDNNQEHHNNQPKIANNIITTTITQKTTSSSNTNNNLSLLPTDSKEGNSAVKMSVAPSQATHNNGPVKVEEGSTPATISSQHQNSPLQVPVMVSSSTPATNNGSTSIGATLPSSSTSAKSTMVPIMMQPSKKPLHHQPMNATLPPQFIQHPPHMYDPNIPYHPVRIATTTATMQSQGIKQAHPNGGYPMMPHPTAMGNSVQFYNQFQVPMGQPTVYFPPEMPPHPGSIYHRPPALPYTTPQPVEAESSSGSEDGSDDESSDESVEEYRIITMQKPSPYTEMKQRYEDLLISFNKKCKELAMVTAELKDIKRKKMDPSSTTRGSTNNVPSPATKKKRTESPVTNSEPKNAFLQPGVVAIPTVGSSSGSEKSNRVQTSEVSVSTLSYPIPPGSVTSPSSDSSSISLNSLVYIYYYDGGCDGHGSRQLKANGKRIFIDINWDEITKFRRDDCLHMCIFVNTSTVDKVKDTDLIATFKILKTDGDKVKISKIRENLRRLNLQNQFSHIGHIKFFIQIRGSDQQFDYTDKILLYSKTQHNIANFEPNNQKEYTELSKLFYQPERFTVFKKV